MTVQSTGHVMWSPDPSKLRYASYTVDDLQSLPDDAPRVELFDGVMRVLPAPTYDHQDIAGLLWFWLRKHAPRQFRASLATGILVESNTTFEPDVLLVTADVYGASHYAMPEQVPLVVEVVSRATQSRGRGRRALYASVGIAHYWRVEEDPVHVFAYDLVDGEYQLAADSDERLVLTAPFEIDLAVRDITP